MAKGMLHKGRHKSVNYDERIIGIRRYGRGFRYVFSIDTTIVAIYESVWPMGDEPNIASDWILSAKVPMLTDLKNRDDWEVSA